MHDQLGRAIARNEKSQISLVTAARSAGIAVEDCMLEASRGGVAILVGNQATIDEDFAAAARFVAKGRQKR